jgi:hypothetical protein
MGLLTALGGLFQSDEDRAAGNLNALQRFGMDLNAENLAKQNIPAPLQVSNAYLTALKNGDIDRANAIQMFAKTLDKGVVLDEQGQAQVLPNYGSALGSIAGTKSAYEQQGRKNVDLAMNPRITGGETAAKLQQEMAYGPSIKEAEAKSGAIGTAAGTAEGANQKKTIQAPQILDLVDRAEKLLPQATSGGLDTAARDVRGYFGKATEGSKADSQLNVIGAALTANVPRMEGPQSDYDVQLYSKAAGDVANSKVPLETRQAALQTIRALQQKYAGGMNSPKGGPVPLSNEAPPGKLIGTSGGKKVYELPDGSHVMEQ